ncbi:MAG: hypothetical protein ACK2UH_16755 [Candidatus Promineifilaceae bacterium]
MGEKKPIKESTIRQAAERLERFLNNPEVIPFVKRLCDGPGKHIIICESYEGGGFGFVYFLDGKGLQCSTEAMGTWIAYAQQTVPPPAISRCTALEVAREYAQLKGDPRQIVGLIREALVGRLTLMLTEA